MTKAAIVLGAIGSIITAIAKILSVMVSVNSKLTV